MALLSFRSTRATIMARVRSHEWAITCGQSDHRDGNTLGKQDRQAQPASSMKRDLTASIHPWLATGGLLLVVYLCWRIIAPFLAALCWAFALTLIAGPVFACFYVRN